ncbi:ankyrin repeat domain-containing protein [Adhaeribacter sp. BT258]|uniref:Ankyrin repeat domain-containing protein n=1 Tax=Adhaeribacter terrigena TaxID=2793070 RepID=A0ABS1BY18_9BACT|nr:ankyrin repeat domain-containing protein [Adhaeribacter terrigena]MBK0402002.1 ankyrin repeat domain-containing protein [Adhaeribacter terrigena]
MDTLLLLLSFLFFTTCSSENAMQTQTSQASLIEAVKNGNLTEVETALKNGADVNTTDKNKRSLLLLATHAKDLKMAQLLVAHGANVNQQDDIQDSPFLFAGASGYTPFVKLFLENGARFDVFNRYGGTALIPACERGHLETVKLLANTKGFPIDHVNRLGWTALMETVVLGDGSKTYVEVTKTLIAAGCNVNIPDKDGVTALQHARKRNFTAIAEVLEKAAKK